MPAAWAELTLEDWEIKMKGVTVGDLDSTRLAEKNKGWSRSFVTTWIARSKREMPHRHLDRL